MLSNRHIDAANQLLTSQFHNFQGLSTPALGQALAFPVYNCLAAAADYAYIQIIHCPALYHWVTVEILFDEDVRVFDENYHLRLRNRLVLS